MHQRLSLLNECQSGQCCAAATDQSEGIRRRRHHSWHCMSVSHLERSQQTSSERWHGVCRNLMGFLMDSVFTHCTCYLHVLAANAVIWSSATETEENRYHVRLATDVCVCVSCTNTQQLVLGGCQLVRLVKTLVVQVQRGVRKIHLNESHSDQGNVIGCSPASVARVWKCKKMSLMR